ncbi:MAG: GTP-dependent dephospho-CoA kinase family protein [Candidatus Altiarchaeota archaeon]
MKLTSRLRDELKKPLGRLAKETSTIPRRGVVVCVGDTASDTLLKDGFKPMVMVYDGKTERRHVGVSERIKAYDAKEYRITNPPGNLEEDVFTLFRKLLKSEKPSKVFVEGEEDLTALAVIREAPKSATLVYGQPGEGLVIVKVDSKIKKKVNEMLEEMEDGG